MPDPNPAALEFLLTRRSVPAKTLIAPYPTHDDLMPILTAAARTPDHGKLEPWRFIVLGDAALTRLADLVAARGQALGIDPDKIEKSRMTYANSGLAVVVVSAPRASDKVPEIEQIYSAGAVCLALTNAALASGWGANWISGWASFDRDFVETGLGLGAAEHVAGIIHLGTPKFAPPDRPRPDLAAITTWVDA
ncbi:nitroreductase [Escherichia coli]|nr:nitroreductase [Escherichia coli]